MLSGKLGVPLYDTGAKIQRILDDIIGKVKDLGGQVTKFRHVSSTAVRRLIGAESDRGSQRRALEARFATVGAGGTVPGGTSSQFTGGVTITGRVHVHGVQDIAEFENQITKRAKAQAAHEAGRVRWPTPSGGS